jgi:hypothetical protein
MAGTSPAMTVWKPLIEVVDRVTAAAETATA